MKEYLDYILLLLAQFGGGPGPKENNLVRFGLPALLWAVLLVVAWSRQRDQELPREKLLVWGFGLGLARELFMFSHVSVQLIAGLEHESRAYFPEPLEHALTMAALIVVAGAFLRYVLDDARITRRYLFFGLGTTVICFFGTWWWWQVHATANPDARFNRTAAGIVSFVMIAVFAILAIALLSRKRGWLSNVVSLALGIFVLIGILRFVNWATGHTYAYAFCPICNTLHILAIPVLGYVYIREQSIEKEQAEEALAAYRDHLQVLVQERTMELTQANDQLQREISERKLAEAKIDRRNRELAAQNTIAATISQSLDLDTILSTAMDTVLTVLEMDAGCLFLLEPDGDTLAPRIQRGAVPPEELVETGEQLCSCVGISHQAVTTMEPLVLNVDDFPSDCQSPFIARQGLRTLVSTPLVSKGRALGALSLGTQDPDAIPPDQLKLLTGIGQQIGMAIENAHLYQETEHWANELTMLHQVSMVLNSTLDAAEIYEQMTQQSAKLLGCQMSVLFRWDHDRQEAVSVSTYGQNGTTVDTLTLHLSDSPIMQGFVARRRSIPIEDGQRDPRIPEPWRDRLRVRGLLCVPVWGTEEPLALLFLMELNKPRRWRPGEMELVESFVNRAAVALENAYLHKQLQWAAALEERQRIAAEMHDGLAQTLSYLNLKTFNATKLVEAGDLAAAMAEHNEMQTTIERATKDVRESIASLQGTPRPRRPLQEWLAETVDEFNSDGGPAAHLANEIEEPLFLPDNDSVQVLRVVQEALLNAGRHARAERITVWLRESGDSYALVIEDDGEGFDPKRPSIDNADHFGLSIMRARAARIGGRIRIDSARGQGTQVTLTWPRQAQGS